MSKAENDEAMENLMNRLVEKHKTQIDPKVA